MCVQRRRLGYVEVVTLDRAEKRNALNRKLVEGIGRAVLDIEADPEVRAMVLTGSGSVFCAGMDLGQIGTERAPRSVEAERFMAFLELGCEKPTIAALNGPAVAGGLELVLACDLVVAAEHAWLGLPEVRRGLVPGGGGTLLPQRIPRALALEIGLTGEPISAQRAYDVGLVNRVAPAEEVLAMAVALAEAVARNSPGAVRRTKQLMAQAQDLPAAQAWEQVRAAVTQAWGSRDAREGAAAFLERREPVWRNPSTSDAPQAGP